MLQESKGMTLDGGWYDTFTSQPSTTSVQSITIGGRMETFSVKNVVIEEPCSELQGISQM